MGKWKGFVPITKHTKHSVPYHDIMYGYDVMHIFVSEDNNDNIKTFCGNGKDLYQSPVIQSISYII